MYRVYKILTFLGVLVAYITVVGWVAIPEMRSDSGISWLLPGLALGGLLLLAGPILNRLGEQIK
jgi:hypothetical protein